MGVMVHVLIINRVIKSQIGCCITRSLVVSDADADSATVPKILYGQKEKISDKARNLEIVMDTI